MKVKFSSLAALTICLLFLACGAFADSIPVTNFSFETHPPFNNSDGTGQWTDGLPIPGWTITGSGGVWMPSNLNLPAYDGNVLAWSNGGSFFQSVGATTAGAMYTLTVEIMHRTDAPMLGTAQLTFNGVPVAMATGNDGGSGTWNKFTATYTASGVGTLGILLSANGVQGDWDDVHLSVPEHSNLAMLLGFGIFNLAAVFGFRRKLT